MGLISPNFVCQATWHWRQKNAIQIHQLHYAKFMDWNSTNFCAVHQAPFATKDVKFANVKVWHKYWWNQDLDGSKERTSGEVMHLLFLLLLYSASVLFFCLCREKNRINFAAKIWTERKSLFNQRNSFITYTYDCINLNSSKSVTRYTVIIAKQHENSCEKKDYNFDGCRAQTWPTFMLHVLHLNFNICICWSLYVFL